MTQQSTEPMIATSNETNQTTHQSNDQSNNQTNSQSNNQPVPKTGIRTILKGPKESINQLTSIDRLVDGIIDRLIIAASDDGTIRVWQSNNQSNNQTNDQSSNQWSIIHAFKWAGSNSPVTCVTSTHQTPNQPIDLSNNCNDEQQSPIIFAAHETAILAWQLPLVNQSTSPSVSQFVTTQPFMTIKPLSNDDDQSINQLVYHRASKTLGACFDDGSWTLWKIDQSNTPSNNQTNNQSSKKSNKTNHKSNKQSNNQANNQNMPFKVIHQYHHVHENICSGLTINQSIIQSNNQSNDESINQSVRLIVCSIGFDCLIKFTRIHRKHEQEIGRIDSQSNNLSSAQTDNQSMNPPFPQCVDQLNQSNNQTLYAIGLGSGDLLIARLSDSLTGDYKIRVHSNAIVAVKWLGSIAINETTHHSADQSSNQSNNQTFRQFDMLVTAGSDRRVRVLMFERMSQSIGQSNNQSNNPLLQLSCVRRWIRRRELYHEQSINQSIKQLSIVESSNDQSNNQSNDQSNDQSNNQSNDQSNNQNAEYDEFSGLRPHLVAAYRHNRKINDLMILSSVNQTNAQTVSDGLLYVAICDVGTAVSIVGIH